MARTILISDELAELAEFLRTPEDQARALEILRANHFATGEDDTDEGEEGDEIPDAPLTPADIEAIRRGLADSDAGRVVDGDEFLRELRTPIAELRARGVVAP